MRLDADVNAERGTEEGTWFWDDELGSYSEGRIEVDLYGFFEGGCHGRSVSPTMPVSGACVLGLVCSSESENENVIKMHLMVLRRYDPGAIAPALPLSVFLADAEIGPLPSFQLGYSIRGLASDAGLRPNITGKVR